MATAARSSIIDTHTEAQFGLLALAVGQRRPLQVCLSAAGFYVGTLDVDGFPLSRESVEYWPRRELAHKAFKEGLFTQRRQP